MNSWLGIKGGLQAAILATAKGRLVLAQGQVLLSATQGQAVQMDSAEALLPPPTSTTQPNTRDRRSERHRLPVKLNQLRPANGLIARLETDQRRTRRTGPELHYLSCKE
ncbi:uncharacterized protein [Nothobranchius furzeri]|uniref:Uncharacterized protein n=2 Tax=Nothobranchius TaxID=28779 RepID=A0A1A8UU98_NOTFU